MNLISELTKTKGDDDDIEKAEERVQEAATDDVENTIWLPSGRWTSMLGTGGSINISKFLKDA